MQLVINIISQTCYFAHEHTNMLLCTWTQTYVTLHMNTQTCYSAHEHTNMLLCTWTHKHVTLHMNTQPCYSAHEQLCKLSPMFNDLPLCLLVHQKSQPGWRWRRTRENSHWKPEKGRQPVWT